MDSAPKKKKANRPVAVEKKPEVNEEELMTAYKGKPSSFFVMETDASLVSDANLFGHYLNADQWSFMLLHYPEYTAAPWDMMVWIYQQAQMKEKADAQTGMDDSSDSSSSDEQKDP